MSRVGWLDCSAGVSGDMLLGALVELGVLDDLADLLASVPELGASCQVTTVTRSGLRATQVLIEVAPEQPDRRLADVRGVVERLPLPMEVRARALAVFDRLARAEAEVHGNTVDEVHFHEVGAVDSIVDVVGACLGLHRLGLDRLAASPIAVGGGSVAVAHGRLPVPVPAVLRLLSDSTLAAHGGPDDMERATPTGVALVAELAEPADRMPAVVVSAVGVGAGGRDTDGVPNVVRLVVGEEHATAADGDGSWQLLEANVDDLDPRLWPGVLEQLFAAGAADAWLTPIVMKKGRPAHTLSALVPAAAAETVRDAMFRESTTIGVRMSTVGKHALDREWVTVDVDGVAIRVKVATLAGAAVTATPEWEDVLAAARTLDRPAKTVLAAAVAAAAALPG